MKNEKIYSFPGCLAMRVCNDKKTCILSGRAMGVGMESVRITRAQASDIIRRLRAEFAKVEKAA
jgi:hypothetical protein